MSRRRRPRQSVRDPCREKEARGAGGVGNVHLRLGLANRGDQRLRLTPVFFRPRSRICRERQTRQSPPPSPPDRLLQRWSKSGFPLGQSPANPPSPPRPPQEENMAHTSPLQITQPTPTNATGRGETQACGRSPAPSAPLQQWSDPVGDVSVPALANGPALHRVSNRTRQHCIRARIATTLAPGRTDLLEAVRPALLE